MIKTKARTIIVCTMREHPHHFNPSKCVPVDGLFLVFVHPPFESRRSLTEDGPMLVACPAKKRQMWAW